MMHWIDMPPVWLAGAIALVWALDRFVPFGGFGVLAAFGPVLVVAGLVLVVGSVVQMTARRTTFIPKSAPAALVTTGFFRLCRNPIYLADALVLGGVILWWDAPLSLPVLPGFVLIITARFILAEEAVLRAAFGPAFEAWTARTGRWLPRG
jgi:protein-S-isoprenylcysteine O-methyltransferase Ste14